MYAPDGFPPRSLIIGADNVLNSQIAFHKRGFVVPYVIPGGPGVYEEEIPF